MFKMNRRQLFAGIVAVAGRGAGLAWGMALVALVNRFF